MISLIEKRLKKSGLIDEKSSYSYNIYLRGANRGEIVYFLFFENGDQFAIKVSKYKSLEEEYRSAKDAFYILKNYISVPEPLCFSDEFGISIMVSRSIRFLPLTNVLVNRYPDVFKSGMYEYIDRSKEHFKVNRSIITHVDMIHKMVAYFNGTAISPLLLDWFAQIGGQKLNSIGYVRQHGDFAVTNIGISSSHLSVIDWEDHGRLILPGIDVLIVCASCLEMEETKIERLIYQKDPYNLSEIINYFCSAYGIRYEFFMELIPLYLTNFLYLKRNYGYGEEIIHQVEKVALFFFRKIIKERQDIRGSNA
jgi:hypothetical protein